MTFMVDLIKLVKIHPIVFHFYQKNYKELQENEIYQNLDHLQFRSLK